MRFLRFRFDPALATLSGILLAIGAGVMVFLPASKLFAALVFGAGLIVSFLGFFENVLPRQKLFEGWDPAEVRRWIRKVPPNSRIRISQTWFPDLENFIPFLRDLLVTQGKRFSLQVMLIPHELDRDDDLLAARIRLRNETKQSAVGRVQDTVDQLIVLKQEVDSAWTEDGARFDLEIKQYHFLPFGPIYQVSNTALFVGFYLSDRSSEAAPMIRLTDIRSRGWAAFTDHFDKGWEDATCLYPRPRNE